jgi:hypothetical protein
MWSQPGRTQFHENGPWQFLHDHVTLDSAGIGDSSEVYFVFQRRALRMYSLWSNIAKAGLDKSESFLESLLERNQGKKKSP